MLNFDISNVAYLVGQNKIDRTQDNDALRIFNEYYA